LYRILAEVEVPDHSSLTFRIRGTPVVVSGRAVVCRGAEAPVHGRVGKIEILADRTSIEAFANDGEASLSACFLPTEDRLELESERGPAKVRSLRVFELRTSWGRPGE
jgi:hypothetical protein